MISLKILPVAIIVLIILYLASLSFFSRHHRIKPENQRLLTPCPETANCVSSEASDQIHAIPSFKLKHDQPDTSWNELTKAIIQSGGEILVNDGRYCHAVFTSSIFRFKDDVEAVLKKDRIDIRSASRIGRSDLGQNRKRIDKIKLLYQ